MFSLSSPASLQHRPAFSYKSSTMARIVLSTFAHWRLVAVFALAAAFFAISTTGPAVTGVADDLSDVEIVLGDRDQQINQTGAHVEQVTERGMSIGSSANYKRCRDTGRKILCAFDNPGRPPATSFTSFSQLNEWGWTQTDLQDFTVSAELDDYAIELNAKGFNVQSPPMRGIKWEHTRETTHSGKRYPVRPRFAWMVGWRRG